MKQLINSLAIAVAVLFVQNVFGQTNSLTGTNRLTATKPAALGDASKLQDKITVIVGDVKKLDVHNGMVRVKIWYSIKSTHNAPLTVDFRLSPYGTEGKGIGAAIFVRCVAAPNKTTTELSSQVSYIQQKSYAHLDQWKVEGLGVRAAGL